MARCAALFRFFGDQSIPHGLVMPPPAPRVTGRSKPLSLPCPPDPLQEHLLFVELAATDLPENQPLPILGWRAKLLARLCLFAQLPHELHVRRELPAQMLQGLVMVLGSGATGRGGTRAAWPTGHDGRGGASAVWTKRHGGWSATGLHKDTIVYHWWIRRISKLPVCGSAACTAFPHRCCSR